MKNISIIIFNFLILILNFLNCEKTPLNNQVEEFPLLASLQNEKWSEVGIIGYDKSSETVDFTPTNHFQLTSTTKEGSQVKLALKTSGEEGASFAGVKQIQFNSKCPINIELFIKEGKIWNFNLNTIEGLKNCEDMDPTLKINSVNLNTIEEGVEPIYFKDYKDEFVPKEEEADNRIVLLAGGDDGSSQKQGGEGGSSEQKS